MFFHIFHNLNCTSVLFGLMERIGCVVRHNIKVDDFKNVRISRYTKVKPVDHCDRGAGIFCWKVCTVATRKWGHGVEFRVIPPLKKMTTGVQLLFMFHPVLWN